MLSVNLQSLLTLLADMPVLRRARPASACRLPSRDTRYFAAAWRDHAAEFSLGSQLYHFYPYLVERILSYGFGLPPLCRWPQHRDPCFMPVIFSTSGLHLLPTPQPDRIRTALVHFADNQAAVFLLCALCRNNNAEVFALGFPLQYLPAYF